jgi:hypothetical protein
MIVIYGRNWWLYIQVTIVNDDSSVTLQIVASLSDDSRGVIYNRNMFIAQATAGHCRPLQATAGHCRPPLYCFAPVLLSRLTFGPLS